MLNAFRAMPLGTLTPVAALLGRRLVHFDAEAGTASLEYLAKAEFANRHGTVQGGILAAMLDSATGAVLMESLSEEFTAVTARLDTTFLKPAPVGPLHATARVIAKDGRTAGVEAELTRPDGIVVARAVAYLRIVKRE